MGAMEFQWQALPPGLQEAVGSAASGEVPQADALRDAWPAIRDGWLLADPDRTARFADLLEALDVGRVARQRAETDEEFLQTVRNSSGLRLALARYLIALGSGPGAADDPAEIAAAPDRAAPAREGGDGPAAGIPGPEFAPQSAADFGRLIGINDLQWGLRTLQLFNAVTRLLPGESVIAAASVEDVANDGVTQGGYGVSIAHGPGNVLLVVTMPEALLPVGITYLPMLPALQDLGWQVGPNDIIYMEFPWPDGADDAAVFAVQTLRSVFLVDSAVRIELSDEIRPPDGLLPAPPAPDDVLQPADAAELLAVVGAIIRAVGGSVLAGADDTTQGFRLGPWAGWIHASPDAPILDVALIVSDFSKPAGQSFDPSRALDLQATGFRFGRVVVTGEQVLVVATMPCHVFSGRALESMLMGVITDATRALGLPEPATPLARGLGGYL